jgi:hypothetical protein
MWSDIETSEDLLGYSVHANQLKDIVTNEKNLPITVGLYGDWGCGKSSILKILEEQLKTEDDTIVVYFDGWSFESFDDAKMALIQGIVDELEKNERFFSKVEDKASAAYLDLKDAFKQLRKSINWMRSLKWLAKTAVPIATAYSTGGASLIPLLLEAFESNKGKLEETLTGEKAGEFLNNILNKESDEKKYEAVREFRKDFGSLIQKSKQGKVVVLIDDLDRCLPRNIIENLEAIKLFLNVPKTAFIIAADKYIVSNAIKSEYKAIIDPSTGDNRPNLGDSYMEKFIQIPYVIPSLSRYEVETYVMLLLCQTSLPQDTFRKIQQDFTSFCLSSKGFEKYGWDNIKTKLSEEERSGLEPLIAFISRFSTIIGTSLRWNPRLIKRFLNAFEIRSNLLKRSSNFEQKDQFALLKLMLLEQQQISLFKQLNAWVMSSADTPVQLIKIEQMANGEKIDSADFQDWNKKEILLLINTEPKFSSVDLKGLYWASRDNIIDEMSGISIIPSRITNIFREIYSAPSESIRERLCTKKLQNLSTQDMLDIYSLIDAKISSNPKDDEAFSIYWQCIKLNIPGAFEHLKELIFHIDVKQIPFSLGRKFGDIIKSHKADKDFKKKLSENKELSKAIEE